MDKLQPEIKSKPAFKVAGMVYAGKNEQGEIPQMWDRFMPRVGELVPDPTHFEAWGVARSLPEGSQIEGFEYLAGVEEQPGAAIPPDMAVWEIPALTYAVLPAKDVAGIGPVSQYFYQEWLPDSKEYEGDAPLMMECYPPTFSEDLIIYLYFPVKAKGK
jgi:AraC family transcriptional regulator